MFILKASTIISETNYFYNQMHQGANIYICPRESLLVLFPAWLEHFVTPVMDFKENRYSISFAIDIKNNKLEISNGRNDSRH